MIKDLGTYYVRVEFENAEGYLQKWETGPRYMHERYGFTRLDADRILPIYENEEELFSNIRYMYEEGNYSCDCNRKLFIASAKHQIEDIDAACGDTIKLKRLTVIRPDGTEVIL